MVLIGVLALVAPAGWTSTIAAAEGAPVMEAAVMLGGHGRVGAWMSIEVRLRNDGPAVTGELRLSGGAQSRTSFGTPVDLPPQSDKTYLLYAQPPAFGGTLDVALVAGDRVIATHEVDFTVHDASQLVVGVIAERPEGIVPRIDLLPATNGSRAAIVPLQPGDLPERVEAWGPLDRLIWHDVDAGQLSPGQIAALRGWIAGGGRLVVAGGTAGGAMLSGFPEELLPYHPEATIDVAPATFTDLVGTVPADAADLPALAGQLVRGRSMATVGEQTVAAEAPFGSGSVALLGFDPTRGWVAEGDGVEALWRRLLPQRSTGPIVTADDGQLVNAVSQLPALALPPIGGLLALLAGYILLIGPINYLVLRKLDKREWAWVTMPVLIAVFAAGAYGFGAALRGLDVIVNEVAIVRGAPDTTEGTAQVYLGVFSPSRGTYQLEVPGGALLSSTLNGELAGGSGGALDVLQGDPARVRDLVVSFGSLRTLRAETATSVPRVRADLRLEDGTLKGTVTNLSDRILEKPAIVLGSSVVVLGDLAAGAQQSVSLPIRGDPFGQSLSDRILGQSLLGNPGATGGSTARNLVRRAVLDQLTFDPNLGTSGQLASESPVLLAWGTGDVLDVRISGEVPRRTGNTLFYIPLHMTVRGQTSFEGDLLRSSVVETDASFFGKEPEMVNMGIGSATLAYRPVAFDGEFRASRVVLGFGFFEGVPRATRGTVAPLDPQPCLDEETDAPDCEEPEPREACDPAVKACQDLAFQTLPALELFDRSDGGRWLRMTQLEADGVYELEAPERYVDPSTGTLLLRFVNDVQEGIGFNIEVRLEGEVR